MPATVFDDLNAPAPTGTVFDDIHPAAAPSPQPSSGVLDRLSRLGSGVLDTLKSGLTKNLMIPGVERLPVQLSRDPKTGSFQMSGDLPDPMGDVKAIGAAFKADPWKTVGSVLPFVASGGLEASGAFDALSHAGKAGLAEAATASISKGTVPGMLGAGAGYVGARLAGLPWEFALPAGGVGAAVGSKALPFVRGAVADLRGEPIIHPEAPEPFKVNPAIQKALNRRATGPIGAPGKPGTIIPRRGPSGAPPSAESVDPFLNDLAQSQAKKSFDKLKPDEQQSIRDLAARLQGRPMTPPPQSMTAPPAIDPVSVANWLKDPANAQATVAEMQKGVAPEPTPKPTKVPALSLDSISKEMFGKDFFKLSSSEAKQVMDESSVRFKGRRLK